MRKIPTLYVRDFNSRPAHVTEEVTPDCEWVLSGEGVATRKFDGTCVMLDEHGNWWARREIKPEQVAPPYFVEIGFDDVTGKLVGWIPIGYSSFARWLAEAVVNCGPADGITGTFELIGPRINGNPERAEEHMLVEHAAAVHVDVPDLTFEGIRKTVLTLTEADGCEGIVWHHEDGRMVKIKARDFRR